jgi:hypothetical protein
MVEEVVAEVVEEAPIQESPLELPVFERLKFELENDLRLLSVGDSFNLWMLHSDY